MRDGPRDRLSGAGPKPLQAAAVKGRGGERWEKSASIDSCRCASERRTKVNPRRRVVKKQASSKPGACISLRRRRIVSMWLSRSRARATGCANTFSCCPSTGVHVSRRAQSHLPPGRPPGATCRKYTRLTVRQPADILPIREKWRLNFLYAVLIRHCAELIAQGLAEPNETARRTGVRRSLR
jgi:hypothetical protein